MITNSRQNTRFRWKDAQKLEKFANGIDDDSNISFPGNIVVDSADNIVDKDGNPIISGGSSGSSVASINIVYDNGYTITAEQKKQIVKANYNCEISLINNGHVIGVFLPIKTTAQAEPDKRNTILFNGTIGYPANSYINTKRFTLTIYYDDAIDNNANEKINLSDSLSVHKSLFYVGYTAKLADGATVNIFIQMVSSRGYNNLNTNNYGDIRNIWSIAYSSSSSTGVVEGPAILLSYSGTTAQFKVYNKAGELETVTGTYFDATGSAITDAYVIGGNGFKKGN